MGNGSAQSASHALNAQQASCHSKKRSCAALPQLSAECCRIASVAVLVVACVDKLAMATEVEKEEWTGGEVLFAGGTDWAKVHMPA